MLKRFKTMQKKGLSPVITTILLVLLAIVLAAIIFLWAKGFVKETPLKFDPSLNEDRPIEELCAKVDIQAVIVDNSIVINNLGSVPINKVQIRVYSGGSSNSEEFSVDINSGLSRTITSTLTLTGNKVEIVPILLGKMKSGEAVPYFCLKNIKSTE
jgi:flagellin-like protein